LLAKRKIVIAAVVSSIAVDAETNNRGEILIMPKTEHIHELTEYKVMD
jgi:hypothetical protein